MKKWLDRYESGGLVSKNSLNRNVTCSNCGWSWKLSDGGLDPMTCHKCGGDIKMREGGELDEYQDKGEVRYTVPTSDVMQNRVPIGMQQIPTDPLTGQPLTREQISRFMPSFNTQQPVISQGTWKGNRTTKDNSFDPYSRIIEQDPQSEANVGKRMRKDFITKKVPAGVTAAAAIMAAPVVAPIVGAAMEAPIAGVAGLTGSNILNAGFATHGLQSVLSGDVVKPWQQAYKSGNPWDYGNAAAENVMTGMELFPLVGPGYKGALEAGNYLTTQTPLKNTYNILPEGVFKRYSKLKNPNKSYRVAGMDAYEDFNNTGVLRSNNTAPAQLVEGTNFMLSPRPTPFPSFQKGYADMAYANPEGSVIFETALPTFKRGEINPVTGFPIKGRHYAHRVIDPKTGAVMTKIPAENIKVFGDKPHWLKGYPELEVPVSSWQQLIQEDKAFNKPNWLKGYGKKSNLKVFTEGQPYEGAPHIYEDMVPVNGRYQPRTVITDAGVKDEILGLEATPIIPLNQMEYPVTSNKFLYGPHNSFGRMEQGTDTYRGMLPGTNTYTSTLPLHISFPNNNFQSEINWGNWNKEIPSNIPLLQEYNTIEQTSKANGSWMKNPDGSTFQGTPEQFVQTQSENWVKAYKNKGLNSVNRVYRGVGPVNSNPDFSKGFIEGDKAIFTADKNLAKSYIHGSKNDKILSSSSNLGDAGYFDLVFNKGNQINYNTMLDDWTNINLSKGSNKLNLEYNLNHQKKMLDRLEKEGKEYNVDIINSTKQRINQLQGYINDYDKIPTNTEEFEKMKKTLGNFTTTDDIADYITNTKLNNITLQNIIDGGLGDVTIVNNRPGNYLKSIMGNNGNFDIWNNPNIYKAIVPAAIGAGALNQKQQRGGAIITNRGQWDYPGQTTIIPSNKITMTGVDYPVLGVDNTGHTKMMHPGMNYTFPGQYVTEYPMMQGGGQMSINDIKNAYKIAANNYNNRVFPEETLQKRQAAYNTINPTDYTDLRNYGRWLADEQRDVYSDPRSEESWKFYLGLTKPEDLKYLKKSQYRPTINATQKNYYSVDPELEQDIFNSYKDKVNLNQTLQTNESEIETPISGKGAASALGRFGVSRGHDDKGDYVSYYDKYDLKDFAQKRAMGVPYSIYGRMYYPKKEQGGEMIKRADGSYSKRGLWDNIRDNRGSGKAPTKQMLDQERKIRNQYQVGGDVPTVQGNFKKQNEYGYMVTDEEALAKEAQRLNSKRVLTENGSLIIFDDNWNIVAADDNPDAPYKEGGGITLNAGGEKHRIYVKTTNRGEGDKGHIMVNHPTMDKGMWDTIDLTQKAGATTIAQGVAATKEWHRENPYIKEFGGDVPMYGPGGSFKESFREARINNKSNFVYNGKTYSTDLKKIENTPIKNIVSNPYVFNTNPIIENTNQIKRQPVINNFIVDPLSGAYVHDPARAAALLNQSTNTGTISKTKDRSVGKQIYNVATNPMTSAQQLINKQHVTGLGSRNIYDNALDLVNPITYAKAIKNTGSNLIHPVETLKKLGNAGLGTLQYITEGNTDIPVGEGYGVLFDALMTNQALKGVNKFANQTSTKLRDAKFNNSVVTKKGNTVKNSKEFFEQHDGKPLSQKEKTFLNNELKQRGILEIQRKNVLNPIPNLFKKGVVAEDYNIKKVVRDFIPNIIKGQNYVNNQYTMGDVRINALDQWLGLPTKNTAYRIHSNSFKDGNSLIYTIPEKNVNYNNNVVLSKFNKQQLNNVNAIDSYYRNPTQANKKILYKAMSEENEMTTKYKDFNPDEFLKNPSNTYGKPIILENKTIIPSYDYITGTGGGAPIIKEGNKITLKDTWDIQPFSRSTKLPKFIQNIDVSKGVGSKNFTLNQTYRTYPYGIKQTYDEGGIISFANGGYVVRRSHDRKGKTHVVTGPDGTKKYFGDPNMGERGNSKYGKEAFYARHKSNLAKNPYFRAYARATWEEGGEIMAIGGQTMMNPVTRKDNRNWLEFLKN